MIRWWWPLSLFALLCAVNAVAADTWGSPVAGVELRISLIDTPHPEIRVTVQNVSETPILLPLGALIGARFHDLVFQVVLTTTDGRDHRVIYLGGPAGVTGRVDPLVVPLVPKASYSVALPIDKLYVLDGSNKLENFLRQPCQLRVELEIQKPQCPLYSFPNPNPNMIPCWKGKVVSNVVHVPN